MDVRQITPDDVESFHRMLCLLDEETSYMMFEPGERELRANDLERLRSSVEAVPAAGDFLVGAFADDGEVVGYLWAQRGKLNRIRHTASIVTGIRRAYRRQGIGTEFFHLLDEWARKSGLVRLELTVECDNVAAKRLYEKSGFVVEGTRVKSMCVDGRLVDEFYLGKILK